LAQHDEVERHKPTSLLRIHDFQIKERASHRSGNAIEAVVNV
jgi:hypothetical protein